MVDRKFILKTVQDLVQINSVNPGLEEDGKGEAGVARYISKILDDLKIPYEIDELGPDRVNITGIIEGTGGGKSLVLNAHMDTVGVEGMSDPFSGKIEGDKLYGRGAYDMKGSISAIVGVAKAVKDHRVKLKGDLILSFVADEEFESIGANALIQKISADAAIVTEPTNLELCMAHRGFCVFKITTEGKTAHGGCHNEGVDANLKMGALLVELNKLANHLQKERKHPLCGEASMHVPMISGGRSLFIYSNSCTIHVERRTIPGETPSGVEQELKQIIRKIQDKDPEISASLELMMWRSPYEAEEGIGIVAAADTAAEGVFGKKLKRTGHTWWEDSAIFGEAGIETIIIGPKGGGIHEEVEWVELDSIHQLAELLLSTAKKFCSVSTLD
ncbi:M20/M25/M40 family metallo-hydrolase [Rhodohalobacter sp. SW132]|uniref:M20/M25/M40 family metallo-hydrolase n=1 Tax=Rhodohalobacter sp. SW132 TaxID=2293433 RepID=UPI000E26DFDA|nr:M20/M25/M40 family metallo-hydrolase [Rhodohalobacter sp. SW132]REL33298.1 M20/M25/M40 family metallo-hydrolase [Rhodohalobacter sp. SW132]